MPDEVCDSGGGVAHGHVAATVQMRRSNGGREFIEVAGLVSQEQHIPGAEGDGHRSLNRGAADIVARRCGLQRRFEARAATQGLDGRACLFCGDPGRVAVGLAEDQGARDTGRSACCASRLDSRKLTRQYNGVPRSQRPVGDSRVTDRTGRILAVSRATQPPREFPAKCGPVISSSPSRTATIPASAAGMGSICAGSGSDSPKRRGVPRRRGSRATSRAWCLRPREPRPRDGDYRRASDRAASQHASTTSGSGIAVSHGTHCPPAIRVPGACHKLLRNSITSN